MPTHKTAHLQTAQADTLGKLAKELFFCQRTPRPPTTLENSLTSIEIKGKINEYKLVF